MSIPSSTYRLQIRPGFTLDAAAGVCDYLAELGVGAAYCSPLLPSAHGSDHGYDVVGFDTVDPQRGGPDGWRRFLATARAHGLGVHVAVAAVAAAANLWSGRVPFLVGCAFGVGALLALQAHRRAATVGLTAVTMLGAPVAGAFLALGLAGVFVTTRTRLCSGHRGRGADRRGFGVRNARAGAVLHRPCR